jgi:hypothetical protein
MTTTYYASITGDVRTFSDVDHAGTSSTAADIIEIRMGNGTYVPTRMEVLLACEKFERWIVQGGLDQLGANLPPTVG